MTETIQSNGLWHVSLAQKDLIEQAELNEEDFTYEFTHFNYKDRKVIISHIYGNHLVVSMEGKDDADLNQLIEAFSKVVEYKPFCKYNLNLLLRGKSETTSLPTYEWDKVDSEGRFEELNNKSEITDLVRINE